MCINAVKNKDKDMITRDNLNEIVRLLSKRQINKIANTDKEYIYLDLFLTNSIASVSITCTNNFNKYNNLACETGNVLFDTVDLRALLYLD
jgi:hypothetical protein